MFKFLIAAAAIFTTSTAMAQYGYSGDPTTVYQDRSSVYQDRSSVYQDRSSVYQDPSSVYQDRFSGQYIPRNNGY